MTTLQPSIDVCDFCYSYHQCYAKQLPFNYAKKQGVCHCSICKVNNVMCADCMENSLLEIKGTISAKLARKLVQLGFAVCRNCVVSRWRTTDLPQKIEAIADVRFNEAWQHVRNDVYLLTKHLQ